MTADFVQNYLFYVPDWYDQTLQSAELKINICDYNVISDRVADRTSKPSCDIKSDISKLLENTASGTALDTVYGKYVLAWLHNLHGEDICTTVNAYVAFKVCILSSDDKSEMSKFNILQFAHKIIPSLHHGTQCNRLD